MPGQNLGPNFRTPFGKNEFLGSTRGLKYESFTVARLTVPTETIDGFAGHQILRPGQVMARITGTGGGGAAADVDKIGPFSAAAADGRQTLANIVGINGTFLPWQLEERDVEVGVLYVGTVIQAKCFEYDSGPALIALTDTTAAAMVAKKLMNITYRVPAADELGTDETSVGW